MSQAVINREAGDKGKGFRLQRLRAIKQLLTVIEEMDKKDIVAVYASTEYLDDVYIKTVSTDSSTIRTEGDKNYDPKKFFSFMSDEVTNSIIIFLDCWIEHKLSDNLFFCFYTTVKYTKENQTQKLTKLGIEVPDKEILKLLIDKNYEYENLIHSVKTKIICEYQKQYAGKKEKGHSKTILTFNDKLWIDFLNRINWTFGGEDEKQLERRVLEDIKNRSFYSNVNVEGKEQYILSHLENLFEKREHVSDLLERKVNGSDVKNIFLELSLGISKIEDLTHTMWEEMEEPTDKRNIKNKIKDVSPLYNDLKIGLLARRISVVKKELSKLSAEEKDTFRFRVFEASHEKILEFILENKKNIKNQLTEVEIETCLLELQKESVTHLAEKALDFSYSLKNTNTVYNTVLELFDSCFLSFDEEGFYNGFK
jgi:hypothetical protein